MPDSVKHWESGHGEVLSRRTESNRQKRIGQNELCFRSPPMILHCDMDAFYASVEERDRPELVGRPVIVGGSPEKRGVVAAANDVARKCGVHSAMPAATAHPLPVEGIFLHPRISYYAEVSRQIREIFERFTPLVEPLSLDEAFLDVTGSQHLFGPTAEIGRKIKQAVREETRLVVSVGVAPNKFLAKIASDLRKPDGFVVVEPGRVQEFLDPLPVERLWGVGKQSNRVFQGLGIRTIGQLRQWPVETLKSRFGSSGECLWELAHGIDDRPVVPEREARSISHETTFEQDVDDPEVLRAWLVDLTEQVGWRLRRHGLRGRTVHLKVRFADFTTITRSQTLPEPTDITHELWQAADDVLCHRLPADHLSVRLLGMGVGSFETGPIQGLLFDRDQRQKQAGLDAAADHIRERFGSSALRRAASLAHEKDGRHDPGGNKPAS
jgi:DNA polymerase-4